MDDLEKKILEAKEDGELDVKNPNAIYSKAQNVSDNSPKRRLGLRITLVNAFIFTLAIGLFVFGLTVGFSKEAKVVKLIINGNNNNSGIVSLDNNEAKENKIKAFESEEELINYLKTNKNSYGGRKGSGDLSNDETYAEAAPAEAEPNSGTADTQTAYKTNTRVEGVDEADIVKVNGDYIFYVTYDYRQNPNYSNSYIYYRVLRIYKHDGDELTFVKEFNFDVREEVVVQDDDYLVKKVIESTINDGLYVTDKYVILPVGTSERTVVCDKHDNNRVLSTNSYHYFSEFKIIDAKTCELIKTIRTRGYNNQTRLIGNELYIVNSYYDYLLEGNNFEYPCVCVDDLAVYANYDSIYYYPNDNSSKTITSVYRVTLDDEITIESFNLFSTYGNMVYMTMDNLYIIDSEYFTDRSTVNYSNSYNKSRIVVISLGDEINYAGEMTVDGNIKDHYSIDEKDQYVRVVTSVSYYENWYFLDKYVVKTHYETKHLVTIFEKVDGEYKEISKITEGIGKPNETIRSVRFNGDILTIVTFKQTDPIYYVDLSDPYNPVITSEFEISGYSTYQIPYKDNYVIGFGYESNGTRDLGIKITLFDVSDKENIRSVGLSYVIPYETYQRYNNTYYSSIYIEAFSNPKAMLVNKDKGLYGFSGYAYYWYDSDYKWFNAYFLFTIDLEKDCPIQLVNETSQKYSRSDYSLRWGTMLYDRMVYIDDYYYLLSSRSIDMFKLNGDSFDKIKTVNAK